MLAKIIFNKKFSFLRKKNIDLLLLDNSYTKLEFKKIKTFSFKKELYLYKYFVFEYITVVF